MAVYISGGCREAGEMKFSTHSKAAGRDGAVRRVPSRGGSTTWRRRWRLGSGAAALAMCGACWRAAGRHGRDGGGREGGGLRRRSLARRCPWQQRISSVALLLSGGLFPGLTWARSGPEKLAHSFRLTELTGGVGVASLAE
jgi:hypothetical protein